MSAPGETLHLLYTVPSPGPVDVAFQRSASCTIRAPDGSSVSCAADTSLVIVKAAPGSTTYSWDIPAPAKLGNYTVSFQETSLLALPGNAPAAQAHFEVRPAAGDDALTKNVANDTTPGGSATTRVFYLPFTNPLGNVQPAEPAAVAKYVLTTASGAGSLVLLLLANRFGS